MPRSRKSRSRTGSVSMLFLAVILPFLAVMLCLGAELTHFFGAHDDVQRIVDRATRASLSKGLSTAETEAGIWRELALLEPLISVRSVRNVRQPRQSDTQVEGEFRGIFSDLAARLTGAGHSHLPLKVSARVRKAQSRVLLVLDRTGIAAAQLCDDENFAAVAQFADRVTASLHESRVEGLAVAVVPGVSRPVELLSIEPATDQLPRCRERDPAKLFDLGRLAATNSVDSPDAVASELLQIVHNNLFAGVAEGRSVIFVGQSGERAENRYAESFFKTLDADMQVRGARVSGTEVMLGGSGARPIELPGTGRFGVELRSVRVSLRELAHPNLVTALRGRVGEKTVLVF